MRKVSLFIAMSLDGYIARSDGGVDWLSGQGDDENNDSYTEFIKNIDTILMGWNTYNQIISELSPKKWVYNDFTTYVITHRDVASSKKIRFKNVSPVDLIKRLKEKNGKDIWICGGANIVEQLVNENLIDVYYVTVIPILLGSGIRLFKNGKRENKLKLINTNVYNGMVDLVYIRR